MALFHGSRGFIRPTQLSYREQAAVPSVKDFSRIVVCLVLALAGCGPQANPPRAAAAKPITEWSLLQAAWHGGLLNQKWREAQNETLYNFTAETAAVATFGPKGVYLAARGASSARGLWQCCEELKAPFGKHGEFPLWEEVVAALAGLQAQAHADLVPDQNWETAWGKLKAQQQRWWRKELTRDRWSVRIDLTWNDERVLLTLEAAPRPLP